MEITKEQVVNFFLQEQGWPLNLSLFKCARHWSCCPHNQAYSNKEKFLKVTLFPFHTQKMMIQCPNHNIRCHWLGIRRNVFFTHKKSVYFQIFKTFLVPSTQLPSWGHVFQISRMSKCGSFFFENKGTSTSNSKSV